MTAYSETVTRAAGRLGGWTDLSFFEAEIGGVIGQLDACHETILPPANQVFAALEGLQPDDVRVVILGQDPYPTPGHGHGLAFSVEREVRPLPRSLGNIFKEMQNDIGTAPAHGDLRGWLAQGVLLLNTALTVTAGEAGSHAGIGWRVLTGQIVDRLAHRDGLVWILWGKYAQGFRPQIEAGPGRDRLILESAHPSPLSARRGFFGSKPFSRTNAHLAKHGLDPIDWTA